MRQKRNPTNGNNTVKRNFLEENRKDIIGWVDEWAKTLDMRAAMFMTEAKRSIRLRLVNRNKVLAEQVKHQCKVFTIKRELFKKMTLL